MVAVGAAAGGVGEAFHLRVAGGHQHVQEAGDVGAVGGDGVGQAAGHAAQRGLVQHIVDGDGLLPAQTRGRNDGGLGPRHGLLAVFQISDVALNELEVGPLRWRDQALHFVQVVLVAGGEVVQAHHTLVELEQGFQQVAANKTRHTCDQPGLWGCGERL